MSKAKADIRSLARSHIESAVKVLTGVMNENLPGAALRCHPPPCRIPLNFAREVVAEAVEEAWRVAQSFGFRTPKRTAAFSYHRVLEKGWEKLKLKSLIQLPTPPPCPALGGRSCPMYCHGFVVQHPCYLLACRAAAEPVRPEFCEAKTRHGTACRKRPLRGKRRCRLHGGLSTGPRTAAGRARIAEAQRARWRIHRLSGGST